MSIDQLRQSEVGDERTILPLVEHDVVRLQVPVQNASGVRFFQSAGRGLRIAGRTTLFQRPVG